MRPDDRQIVRFFLQGQNTPVCGYATFWAADIFRRRDGIWLWARMLQAIEAGENHTEERKLKIMRDYELTIIGKPDLDNTNLTVLIERVKGYVTTEGGSIEKTDLWGMRHLTYPIRKFRDGHYVHMVIKLDGSAVSKIEGRLRLTEEVIRHLLVSTEDETAPVTASDTAPAQDAQSVEASA
jgi:small subunit ribosomal protein S6